MSKTYINIDLVRLSQSALPIAKKHNTDGDGNLNATEYENFMTEWNSSHSGESPLLMQLHTKSLTDEAFKIAEQCDGVDDYDGVLTEEELKSFMDLCDKNHISSIFKKGETPKSVISGSDDTYNYTGSAYKTKKGGAASVRSKLFKNWLKLDIMSFKGSDKYFHAVGNFEAMGKGSEDIVKEVCAGQDEDKRSNMQRPENDYTEDLYANFLGREFAKMYPEAEPHDLFSGLAPEGFDVEESKLSCAKLLHNRSKGNDGYLKRKIKGYVEYFKEDFIVKRTIKEIKEAIAPKSLVEKSKDFVKNHFNKNQKFYQETGDAIINFAKETGNKVKRLAQNTSETVRNFFKKDKDNT